MKLIEKRILDFKMYLDREDEGISKELLQHGIREKPAVDYIKTILRPDMIVLDIGANIGYYALLEASKVNHVHAIEPVKYNFELLTKNIKLNSYKNVSTYRLAIGNMNGVTEIYTSKRCNWATIIPEKQRFGKYVERFNRFKKGVEKVPIYTLDKFIKKYAIEQVDLLRMDVEGAEIDIIIGGLDIIKSMPKNSYLVIEIHGSCIKDKKKLGIMLNQIEERGFIVIRSMNRKHKLEITNMNELRDVFLYDGGCPQCYFKKG